MTDLKQYDPTVDGAIFDESGKYRHMLWRKGTKPAAWICLNPSKASGIRSDQSFDSMLRISIFHGFDTAVVVNLHDYILTESEKLKLVPEPCSPYNLDYIEMAASLAPFVICAWGNRGDVFGKDKEVKEFLKTNGIKTKCLKISKQGQPEHPLYKRGNHPLIDFDP